MMSAQQQAKVLRVDFTFDTDKNEVYDVEKDTGVEFDVSYDVFDVLLAGLVGLALAFLVIALAGVITWSATMPAVGMAIAGVSGKAVDRASRK